MTELEYKALAVIFLFGRIALAFITLLAAIVFSCLTIITNSPDDLISAIAETIAFVGLTV